MPTNLACPISNLGGEWDYTTVQRLHHRQSWSQGTKGWKDASENNKWMIVQCAIFSESLHPRNIDKSFSDIRNPIRFPFESSFWISVSGCKLTILPDIQPANRIVIISVSVWKLGSRASGNIAFYLEKLEKKIVPNMISKNRNFSWYNYYSTWSFFAWPQFASFGWSEFDPVESLTLGGQNVKSVNQYKHLGCFGYWALRWQRHSETTAISILCNKQAASLLFPLFKCCWKRTFSFLLYAHVCISIMV